jgi:glycosyltransferase involved in cell wall biosynthesis
MISVLLPNLNSRKFIEERLESIFSQTYASWELVVFDNYSDDGSWEIIQRYAAKEPRMRISQAPREGMYANWNNCIRQAKGEYIYIATADDTMMPDCLEKMVRALEVHPECGISHCNLKIIDEKGNWLKGMWERYLPQLFYGDLIQKEHIRKAPLDGLLHFAFRTVYTSVTQLLIRKSVFSRVGLFPAQWGSQGDFYWGMRAAFFFDTIHIPEYLATWRIYLGQATHDTESSPALKNLHAMTQATMREDKFRDVVRQNGWDLESLNRFYENEILKKSFLEKRGAGEKALFIAGAFLTQPRQVTSILVRNWRGMDELAVMRAWLKRGGLDQKVILI